MPSDTQTFRILHLHLHLSCSHGHCWGTLKLATLSLHLVLFSDSVRVPQQNFIPFQSKMWLSQPFFCQPLLLPPCIVSCKIVLASPADLETWPKHFNLHFFITHLGLMIKMLSGKYFFSWTAHFFSQQLPSCVIATKDLPFCKCFRYNSALSKKRWWQTFRRNYTNMIKKREETEMKNSIWNLKNALTSTNPHTVKPYKASMCFGIFSFLIIV